MHVKINIFSRTGGEEQKFSSRGVLKAEGEAFSVFYGLDGDDCVLEYSGGVVTQRRSGHLTFVMQFAEGQKTECILSEKGHKFVFPVFTTLLGASLGEGGCSVTISYVQGDEVEPTELVFTAERERIQNERRAPRAR